MSDELKDFLRDKDQILMAAWTLPNEGELTPAQRKQAMANFDAYIRRRGISRAKVGRMVGTPGESTIHDLIKGKYRENADKHIRTLNNWVEQHARQALVQVGDELVETAVAKKILAAARLVRENKTMGLVVGPAGIGKSRCARALQETTAGAILITARYGCCTPSGLRVALADELNVRVSRDPGTSMVDRVITRLDKSNRLLIVDEAHKLAAEGLEFLRELHDATGCPVFMLATKDLADRIRRTADPDHGQIFSRVDILLPLTAGKSVSDGGRGLFTIEEIRKLYQQTPIRLADDAARYLLDVANYLGQGSLRRCKNLMFNAVRRARKRMAVDDEAPVTVTADDLAQAEEHLRPDPGDRDDVRQRRERVTRVAASA